MLARSLIALLAMAMLWAAPAAAAKNKTKAPVATTNKAAKVSTPEKAVVEDALWVEARTAVESGRPVDAKALLRLCLRGEVNVVEAESVLRGYLASDTALLVNNRQLKDLKKSELQELLHLQSEVCEFRTASAEDWRRLLDIAAAFGGSHQLVLAGQAMLDKIAAGMPVKLDEDWVRRFKELEKQMNSKTLVLYRLQLIEILAGTAQTAKEYQSKLEDMRILARANAVRILGQADVAMAQGDLDLAGKLIGQVKNFNPQYPGIDRSEQRLARATEIKRLVGLAGVAMRERTFLEAKRLCGEIQKLDANNAFARVTIQQIDEISSRGVVNKIESAEERVKLAIRKLESDLRRAEQEQDALQIRAILKELLLLKADNASWVERLAEIENQIAVSGFNAEENFKQAQALFKEERYDDLRLLLNRNPGLMNSVDTMIQAWEMRLMANYYTGRQDVASLRDSARSIISRAGQSFYASFVLMKLDIADNRIDDARVHYQNAVKINAGYPGLRWPGWLLWAHGEGRPVVVVVLIVVFFLLVQLLRPAFAFYESTYWFRVSLLARIFPSLALRSLEGCFGIYRDTSDRIKLFRLLVRCSNAVGDAKKVAMYAANLHELVPHDALARSVGAASGSSDQPSAPEPAGESYPVSDENGRLHVSEAGRKAADVPEIAQEPARPVVSPIATSIKSGLGRKKPGAETVPVESVDEEQFVGQISDESQLSEQANPDSPDYLHDPAASQAGSYNPSESGITDTEALAAGIDYQNDIDPGVTEQQDFEEGLAEGESSRVSRLEDENYDIPDRVAESGTAAEAASSELFGDLFGNGESSGSETSAPAAEQEISDAQENFEFRLDDSVPEGTTDLPGFVDGFVPADGDAGMSSVDEEPEPISGAADNKSEEQLPAAAKLDYDEYESATLAGIISLTEAENSERQSVQADEKMDYHEYEGISDSAAPAVEPDEQRITGFEDRSLPSQQPEAKVFDLDSVTEDEAEALTTHADAMAATAEALAASEHAPVYNVEDTIRETRTALFSELDAMSPPGEISDAWRTTLRKPVDSAVTFPELQ